MLDSRLSWFKFAGYKRKNKSIARLVRSAESLSRSAGKAGLRGHTREAFFPGR
jgi:hypothetical protein